MMKAKTNDDSFFIWYKLYFTTTRMPEKQQVYTFYDDSLTFDLVDWFLSIFNSVSAQQAFSVIISSTVTQPLVAGQTVMFDTLLSNLGSSFDIHLSTFRAKANGWYIFSLTVLSKPSETLRLDVVRNGAEVFHVYATGNEYNAASKTMVVNLRAGDELWVRSSPDFSNNVHGYGHTSFTGFLLYST